MKYLFAFVLSVLMALASPVEAKDVRPVHIESLNSVREKLDSHAGEEMYSNLEPMATNMQVIPATILGCKNPVYARIKKLADGRYFLMYHNGRIGSSVWYNLSDDLINWSEPRRVFTARTTVTPNGDDEWRYSSADAIVLDNGDLLAYVALRANHGYRYFPQCNHIAMRRSTDNAQSWDEEQFIYDGTVWEPYMLQLPSGRIQCYFTDTEPQKLNSGTSIVESYDNGVTWLPGGLSNCYKVIRQYKYTDEGTDIYTDQMPCVRMLNDGHTLLGFMESRLGSKLESGAVYKMTIVRGVDDWKHLGPGECGPEDRDDNVISGAAGYVSQFPSGETVLSCNLNQIFQLKLGDCTGRHFQGLGWDDKWLKAFPLKGYWGSTEVDTDHIILGTIHCDGGIQMGRFYLNHRIDAAPARIRVDGDNRDWPDSHAWYIGSLDASLQTCVRVARSGKKLCFVFDRLDASVEEKEGFTLYITGGDSLETLSGTSSSIGALAIHIGSFGTVSMERWSAGVWTPCANPRGLKVATSVSPEGSVTELALPISALSDPDGSWRVMVTVHDTLGDDTFTWATSSDPSSWVLLRP